MTSARIDAVLFDMDGTLIHTEHHTDHVVSRVLASHSAGPLRFDAGELHGLTWGEAGRRVQASHPELRAVDVGVALREAFAEVLDQEGLCLIPGSNRFFSALKQALPVGLYTSNVRAEVDRLQREYPEFCALKAVVTGEDVVHSKPHPEGYLLLAEQLRINPDRCLVFEDSIAGLQAARAAGMQTVAVLHGSADREAAVALSDHAIDDYTRVDTDPSSIPGLPIIPPSVDA